MVRFEKYKKHELAHILRIFIDLEGSIFIESFLKEVLMMFFFPFIDFTTIYYNSPLCSYFLQPFKELFIRDR